MKKKSRPKPAREEIARCACLIYESRGREHGRDLEDWLEAETQLPSLSLQIIGHGVEEKDVVYCCAHCAKESGAKQVKDRA